MYRERAREEVNSLAVKEVILELEHVCILDCWAEVVEWQHNTRSEVWEKSWKHNASAVSADPVGDFERT